MACDYIIFDLETTCLNSKKAEIIEIGALEVCDGEIVRSFSSLIKPIGTMDPAALQVNRIAESELLHAPSADDVFPAFLDFIGNSKLVGYNISSFDLPIIKRYASSFGRALSNDYADVFYMARKRLPNLSSHRLASVASYFLINAIDAHRALRDCEMTMRCYESLRALPEPDNAPCSAKTHRVQHTSQTAALQQLQALIQGILSDGVLSRQEVLLLEQWLQAHSDLEGNYPFDRIATVVREALEDGILEDSELQDMYRLFSAYEGEKNDTAENELCIADKNFVLTGDFECGSKSDVAELISSKGGICKSGVSKKTDYLIVGNVGSADWSYGNYGTKIKRAKEIQAQGGRILILSETDFFACVSDVIP